MRRSAIPLLAVIALAQPALGADPVTYTIRFTPSGDAALDSLLAQTSSLVALQKKLPPAPFALIGRAQTDAQQFLIVLHSLGYDAGQVAITIDGAAPVDPTLVDTLTQAPAGQKIPVVVTVQKGQVFRLGQVNLPGLPRGFTPPAMVKPGDPALAAPILDATGTLRTALHTAGYAFATVSAPLAIASISGKSALTGSNAPMRNSCAGISPSSQGNPFRTRHCNPRATPCWAWASSPPSRRCH
jgi:translocation and assembly module TamA